jgi:hypothetical protein
MLVVKSLLPVSTIRNPALGPTKPSGTARRDAVFRVIGLEIAIRLSAEHNHSSENLPRMLLLGWRGFEPYFSGLSSGAPVPDEPTNSLRPS